MDAVEYDQHWDKAFRHKVEDLRISHDSTDPWTSGAFNVARGFADEQHWAKVPADVDVLVTHGPPHGILDSTFTGLHVGSEILLKETMSRIRPSFHIFGHIHEAYGATRVGKTVFVNAASSTLLTKPRHAPAAWLSRYCSSQCASIYLAIGSVLSFILSSMLGQASDVYGRKVSTVKRTESELVQGANFHTWLKRFLVLNQMGGLACHSPSYCGVMNAAATDISLLTIVQLLGLLSVSIVVGYCSSAFMAPFFARVIHSGLLALAVSLKVARKSTPSDTASTASSNDEDNGNCEPEMEEGDEIDRINTAMEDEQSLTQPLLGGGRLATTRNYRQCYLFDKLSSFYCRTAGVMSASVADIVAPENRAAAFGILFASQSVGYCMTAFMAPFFSRTIVGFNVKDFGNLMLLGGVLSLLGQGLLLEPLVGCFKEKGVIIIALIASFVRTVGFAGTAFYPYKWVVYASSVPGTLSDLSFPAISALKSINVSEKPFLVLNQILRLGVPFSIMYFMQPTGSITPYFVLRLVDSGYGVAGVMSAAIADAVAPEDRAAAFGILFASLTVGYCTGAFAAPFFSREQGRLQGAIYGARSIFEALGPVIFASLYAAMTRESVWSQALPYVVASFIYLVGIGVAILLPVGKNPPPSKTVAASAPMLSPTYGESPTSMYFETDDDDDEMEEEGGFNRVAHATKADLDDEDFLAEPLLGNSSAAKHGHFDV
ncbi:Metallo-dependent phosphatase-like [Phytophthora cactorum]|nr:Metallo-dependent phosphatase-like [Phytophthora cactorum]